MGVSEWKMFTSHSGNNRKLFYERIKFHDIPFSLRWNSFHTEHFLGWKYAKCYKNLMFEKKKYTKEITQAIKNINAWWFAKQLISLVIQLRIISALIWKKNKNDVYC